MSAVGDAVVRGWRGVRWYLREWSGEARWDEHLAACARTGEEPLTRRAFERQRDHQREHGTHARCC